MKYNILEARIEYKDGYITRITVLVDCSDTPSYPDIRAIYATTGLKNGYTHIPERAELSEDLLQNVAGYGMETVDRDEIFPQWKKKLNKKAGR
jgi:hypothetical protein